ncbi:hypothetical protein EDB92DRAFT_1914897 [Lactarius akahatsu]|uniref:Histone H2A C-terminal domain-containing protein n=1 Tax=Lactarius akahatsu TaxID=416441 RepID=A0AAD4Q4S8_9AGAM|nr:hypothetical protein EDB92DRAFT_1914897 [Lactarius akahatsu]
MARWWVRKTDLHSDPVRWIRISYDVVTDIIASAIPAACLPQARSTIFRGIRPCFWTKVFVFLGLYTSVPASGALIHDFLTDRQGDEELNTLVRATIAGGGVMPFIHKSLTAGKIKKPEGAPAA